VAEQYLIGTVEANFAEDALYFNEAGMQD